MQQLITDGTSTIRYVNRSLKKEYGNLLHVTCKITSLYLLAETIRQCYPQVDALITNRNAVFRKCIQIFTVLVPKYHRRLSHDEDPGYRQRFFSK